MGWPQWTYVLLAGLGLGIHMALHGKARDGEYNFFVRLVAEVISVGLLYAGGFFTPAHAQVPQQAQPYRSLLVRTARSVWGLDAPVAVFAAQVHQESGWRPDAVSHVGAAGMAQFMPATSAWIATVDPALAANQPFSPAWSLRALVRYDQLLYRQTPANYTPRDRMWVALRAYNGGLGHWQAEARSTGLRQPTREQVDASCGMARRAALHCRENLDYPRRILLLIQPRYAAWGPML